MAEYLAIDIGGTYIKHAFISDENQLYGLNKLKTLENNDGELLNQLEAIIDTAIEMAPIQGIGISTPGMVDRFQGEILSAGPTIKNYTGTKLKAHLTEIFGLPIHVENNANAALLGELWQGSAQGLQSVYCITLGTDVGGAYYHNGLVDGYYHQANSVGYLLYDADTDSNFETRASISGLNTLIKQHFGQELTAESVFEQANQGDDKATNIIHNWSKEVAKGLAQIILLVDPKCILISGEISRQGDDLLHPIKQQLEQFLPEMFLKTEIKMASLLQDAALYGAIFPFKKEEF